MERGGGGGGWVVGWVCGRVAGVEGLLGLKYKNQKCINSDLVEKPDIPNLFTMEDAIRPKVVKIILRD